MKNRRLPLLSLLAFEATARLGRQSAAADELGITSGAVSRHIRNLEQCLDAPLMAGSRRSPTLSLAARQLADELTPAFDRIDAAVARLMNDKVAVLDVSCLASFAMRWLIPRLTQFHAAYPGVEVRLTTKEPVADFQARRCDVAILVIDDVTRLQSGDMHLFDEKMTVVYSPALVAGHGVNAPADISAMTRLGTRTRPNAWNLWDAAHGSGNAGSSTQGRVFEHYTFAIEAAASGLGACAVPSHLVADDIANGRLVAPLAAVSTGYRYLARCRDRRVASVDQFCRWLQMTYQRDVGEPNSSTGHP